MAQSLQALVEQIVRALVDHPDQISVRNLSNDQSPVLELRVTRDDLGKVIGRQGTTARAIRTVLMAAASKRRKRVILNIAED